MLQFKSPLLAICGAFTGPFAPFQSVHVEPAPQGGVIVVGSDGGKVTAVGFDPSGKADESVNLLPGSDLLAACKAIKGAERDITVQDASAQVTTYRKTKNETKEFALLRSQEPYPPIQQALARCLETWGSAPELSRSAGRYSVAYLEKALKAAGHLSESVVLSAFDGGPLRLQADNLELLVMVMPQTREPIPPLPEWAITFANGACHSVQHR